MGTEIELREEDIAWIVAYAEEVVETFEATFSLKRDRFNDSHRLIERFNAAVADVLAHGRKRFRAVDEAHNELCVANAILENTDPVFARVEYEPPLKGCRKTIDFRSITDEKLTTFIDVKTIKPYRKTAGTSSNGR